MGVTKKEKDRRDRLACLQALMEKHDMNAHDLAKLVDGKWQTARTWCSGETRVPKMVLVILRQKDEIDALRAAAIS